MTIASRTGHRRILHDYWVKDGASGFVEIKIGNNTVIRIYDNLAQAQFVAGPSKNFMGMGFLGTLEKNIPNCPVFNAAQDESIIFTRDSAFDALLAHFEDQDSGDVTARGQPGGSQSSKQLFMLNMSNAAAIAATGTVQLTRQDMPPGVTLFTDTTRMAANNRFTCYAVAANVPVNVASKTTRVHIFDEFTELFTSETNQGLLVDPTIDSELQWNTAGLVMKWMPEPYVFEPNKILTFKIDATYDGANALAAGSQQVFLIGVREYLK